MAHLQDYDEAVGPLAKALAALDCHDAKKAKDRAWYWAEIAAEHAEEYGVENAAELIGDDRWPETETLRQILEGRYKTLEEFVQEIAEELDAMDHVNASTKGDGQMTLQIDGKGYLVYVTKVETTA